MTGTNSGVGSPYLLLDFRNGYPNYLAESDSIKQASLTEGEAVALWDVISRTLRPRPHGF
ncbi:T6SS immunity protein Tli4 family protein [Pandoraea terrae]